MSPALPLFSLGLLLGGSAVWFGLRPADPAPAIPVVSGPVVVPAWSWRDSAGPAVLSADTAAAAITAWLDLHGPDGSPAGFALRADSLRALLVRLPVAEFPRLLTPLAKDLRASDERRLRQIAFDAWLGRDPAAAARWAATSGRDTIELARQAVRAWARLDAAAAAEWACALRDEKIAHALAGEALGILAEGDSARALSLAATQGQDFLDKILPTLIAPLAKADPAAALRTYGPRLWKKGRGFWELREPLAAWTARDPAAALAWIVAQPRSSDGELSNWLGNLADGKNPAALASAIASVPGLPSRQASLGQLLFSWGTAEPEKAIAWLDSLPDRDLRTVLLEQASHMTYTEHPERSLPLALAMPEGASRTERLSDLLGQWAKRDPSAALAWLRGHDEPGVAAASSAAHAEILGTIARDEPATALAEWKALPEGATKQAALTPIATAWAQTDPGAALQWLGEQEAAYKQRSFHDALIYSWAQKDPLAALRWAESQPKEMQTAWLGALAGTWQEKANRAATADLYAQIQEPALRSSTLMTHLLEWLGKDPAAAKTWLESHDALSPEQTAALLAANPGPKN